MNKTKIIATLGTASLNEHTIKDIALAGASIFRINTSHCDLDSCIKKINTIKNVSNELNKKLSILIDLQGPKVRIGTLKAPYLIEKDDEVVLEHYEDYKGDTLPIDYKDIARDVNIGDDILINDGKVKLQVIGIENNRVKTRVIYGSCIESRKGVNIPTAQDSLQAITDRDREFLKIALEQDVDYIALSFVRTAEDVKCARYYMKAYGNKEIPIIAKIEKPQAVKNLDEILAVSTGIMVARGDLGIEMPLEELPLIQKKIIRTANNANKLCIVATQMLESMIDSPIPTRAEVSDVANAIYDGTNAVMLSGETAVGKYPVETVKMMKKIVDITDISKYLYPLLK